MLRMLLNNLESWLSLKAPKVLMLRGARQVGKTFLARELGKKFENYIEINFEEEKKIHAIFDGDLDARELARKISVLKKTPVVEGQTLIFFDEIQSCPNALRSLRFFYEKIPGLHVLCAGSLLEFVLEEIPSFGVGRIESLFLFPLSFKEFLLASENGALLAEIESASFGKPLSTVLHDRAIELLREYLFVGGLPEAVSAWIEKRDYASVARVHQTLISGYRDDFAKYKRRVAVHDIDQVFAGTAGKAGTRVKYTSISQSLNNRQIKSALDLLNKAGILHFAFYTAASAVPLAAQMDQRMFKPLLNDCGLYQRLSGVDAASWVINTSWENTNKGNLAELFVGLEILANSTPWVRPELFFWENKSSPASAAEIDYLITSKDKFIPLEVKAGASGRLKSLSLFLDLKKGSPSLITEEKTAQGYGIKLSLDNFADHGSVKFVPLYAAYRLVSDFTRVFDSPDL